MIRRLLFSAALVACLGAGCATVPPPVAEDPTPGVNEANCLRSGGIIDGDACACPDGFFDDPAGFCLDAQGRPGGAMVPTT